MLKMNVNTMMDNNTVKHAADVLDFVCTNLDAPTVVLVHKHMLNPTNLDKRLRC